MEGIIVAVDFFREEGEILVGGRKDDAVALEGFPVTGGGVAYAKAGIGNGGVGEMVSSVDFGDTTIPNSKSFQWPITKEGGFGFDPKLYPVVRPCQPQVRQRGKILTALISEDAGVRGVIAISDAIAHDLYTAGLGRIEHRGGDPAGFLHGAFGNTKQEANATLITKGPGIEHTSDLHVCPTWDDILRAEDGVGGETVDEVAHGSSTVDPILGDLPWAHYEYTGKRN